MRALKVNGHGVYSLDDGPAPVALDRVHQAGGYRAGSSALFLRECCWLPGAPWFAERRLCHEFRVRGHPHVIVRCPDEVAGVPLLDELGHGSCRHEASECAWTASSTLRLCGVPVRRGRGRPHAASLIALATLEWPAPASVAARTSRRKWSEVSLVESPSELPGSLVKRLLLYARTSQGYISTEG